MSKLVEIEFCNAEACKYCRFDLRGGADSFYCDHPDSNQRTLPSGTTAIPPWCPLEDAGQKPTQMSESVEGADQEREEEKDA